jgi:hypothetical protein
MADKEQPDPDNTDKGTTDKDADKPTGDVSHDQLVQAVRWLVANGQQMGAKIEAIGTAPVKDAVKDPDPEPEPEAADLEGMSRADFMKAIVGAVKTQLTDPMSKQFADADDQHERRGIQTDIDKAAVKYGDFWDWQVEARKILNDKPNLSIDEAYHLARATNPEKLQTMQTEAEKKVNAEKDSEKEKRDLEYGGLLPTSGKSKPNEKMEIDKAADVAWEEVMGGTPYDKMVQ